MTRAKEITKEAKKFAKEIDDWEIAEDVQDAFEQGAVWADAHPDIDVRTMAAWQSGYNEGIAKSRWISVEDELPPLNQDVLVCSVINQDNAVAIDRIIQNIEDNGYADWELYTDITHWMPLPSIEHLRETSLSKACEWLMENIYNYSASGHGIQREQLIKDFKQAMKGG